MTKLMNGPIKYFTLGIYDGPHATPRESEEGPVFLGIKNVSPDGRLDYSEIRHVSEQDFPKWTKRVTPQTDDIVFSYEATLHRYAIIPEGFRGCLGRRMALVRPDKKKVHPRFLHYYFMAPQWRAVVEANIISGATVDRIPIKRFPNFEVKLPQRNIQEKIASILSAYDDLIENNRRRIQLLEQAARLLYKEWFVHLRFPGHEHVKINNGVPEGWERKSLGELADSVIYGYTARAQSEAVGPKLLRITDIVPDTIDWESVPFCKIDERSLAKFALQEGDIVVARTGATVGYAKRIGILEYPTIFASYLIRFRFLNRVDDLIAGIFMESSEFKGFVLSNAGGAAQPNANAKILSYAMLLVPPKSVQQVFRKFAQPIYRQRDLLQQENEKLKKARDLLLPRLMNGEIAV